MTICAEAALKIRELESQVAFLAADREQWKRQALATNITMRTLLEAKAEVARLHQALRDIALLSQKVTGDDKKQLTPQDDNDTVLS